MNTIIENLLTAREVIQEAPDESVNLQHFGRRTPCGTLYCAAGWLAASGRFKEHMDLDWYTRPGEAQTFATLVKPTGGLLLSSTMDTLFGEEAFHTLFTWRGAGELDDAWPSKFKGSDRDLALWRLDQHIITQRILAIQEVQDLLELGDKLQAMSRSLLDVHTEDGVILRTLKVQLWRHDDDSSATLKEMGQGVVRALETAGHSASLQFVENRLTHSVRLWIKIS